ncbi:probable E3 ubiquitin-protein ligase ARI2 [Prosopis cineraria]|uniref:probable E3 ubiquitin-protein ligase ARI2 n=1 Tax=Prosopis cineraria TaxID=364024 RepID=UPI00240F63D5|nr:probable E3 ubiquitin-protein ligase ARI2 [Prosopis cineraria]
MDDYWCSDDDYNCSDQGSIDEEYNDEGFNDDELDIGSPVTTYNGPTALVITRESLVAVQKEDLRRVMEMLSLREHHARVLLIHHRWDVEKLFAEYVEKGKSAMFTEAGVTCYEFEPGSNSDPSFSSSSVSCEICIEDVPINEITRMDCGHSFCNDCWTSHFIVKINDGQSKHIRCMAHKCNAICDESVVRNLLYKEHTGTAEKFDRFLIESYIEDNKRVKWCPSVPHCGNAIRVDDQEDELCEVECCCGLQFCFGCSSEAHSPCSCLMWEIWSNKCKDESATVNWITAHTKPCPKCSKPVEKNGGCNLVSCVCGQPFCWLCGAATGRDHTWSTITGHSCGRYQPQEKIAELAKQKLYRYIHYHDRYKAHTDSLKLESKLKETMQDKVDVLEERNMNDSNAPLRDYSWVVKDGLTRLFRSRRVLCHSYPFAYFMFGGEMFNELMSEEEREIKQNLFEDQQQQLEANIERLSKFLEERFDRFENDKVMEIRNQVTNLSIVVDNLCQKMFECIENDLLGSLHHHHHRIAPYRSKGIERASKLSACSS